MSGWSQVWLPTTKPSLTSSRTSCGRIRLVLADIEERGGHLVLAQDLQDPPACCGRARRRTSALQSWPVARRIEVRPVRCVRARRRLLAAAPASRGVGCGRQGQERGCGGRDDGDRPGRTEKRPSRLRWSRARSPGSKVTVGIIHVQPGRTVKSEMLASIVPADVIIAGNWAATSTTACSCPRKNALSPARSRHGRAEFTAVRVLARQALAKAGLPAAAVVPGPSREPLWPGGIVGSITHCAGYRGRAIARTDVIAAIGIDAEPHQQLPDGVLPMVATESSARPWARLATSRPDHLLGPDLVQREGVGLQGLVPGYSAPGSASSRRNSPSSPAPAFTARLAVPGPHGRRREDHRLPRALAGRQRADPDRRGVGREAEGHLT